MAKYTDPKNTENNRDKGVVMVIYIKAEAFEKMKKLD